VDPIKRIARMKLKRSVNRAWDLWVERLMNRAPKGGPGSGHWGHPGMPSQWGGSQPGDETWMEHPKEVRGSFDPDTGEFDLERHLSYTDDMTEEEYDEYDELLADYIEEHENLDADEIDTDRPEPMSRESMEILSDRMSRIYERGWATADEVPMDEMEEVLEDTYTEMEQELQDYMREEIERGLNAEHRLPDMIYQYSEDDQLAEAAGPDSAMTWDNLMEQADEDDFFAMLYGNLEDSMTDAAEFLTSAFAPQALAPTDEPGELQQALPGSIRFESGRAYYRYSDKSIYVDGMRPKAIVHEMAHRIHHEHQDALRDDAAVTHVLAQKFFERRTADETTVEYGGEDVKADRFINPYAGRIYGVREEPLEVLSVGVEAMYEDPDRFYNRDPEHFALTLAFMHGGTVI